MDQSIGAPFCRTAKSRGRFRSCYRKVASDWVHCPVRAPSCWYRRRMGLVDFVLTIGRWTRSMSRIGTQSHRFVTFWTRSRGPNISAILTWSLVITRYRSNPLTCGRMPSNPRRAFSNGWSCLSGWGMPLQSSWGWWTTSCNPSPTHLRYYIWVKSWSSTIVGKSTSTIFHRSSKCCDNTNCVPI